MTNLLPTFVWKPSPRREAAAQRPPEVLETSAGSGEFNYAITGLPPGEYRVSITPANFLDETKTAVIENQDVRLDFALDRRAELQHFRTVTGLETGKSVQIKTWSQSRDVSKSVRLEGTGEDTDYTFTGLKPAPDYVVELVSSDYPYQVFDGRYRLENADFVDLSEGDASEIDFELTSDTATISGEVIFPADASPGETARVNLFSRITGSEGSCRDSDDGFPDRPLCVDRPDSGRGLCCFRAVRKIYGSLL
jgi:hypothetical protein